MFNLISPIPTKYFDKDGFCVITQLFGENGAPFYKELGLKGHNGIDFATKWQWRWLKNKFLGGRVETGTNERRGIIPIVASHDGYLFQSYNDDLTKGVGMEIMSDEVEIDGKKCKVKTVYFHFHKLRRWKGDDLGEGWEERNGKDFVKAGTIIGWSDNSGKYTTGAHLHFGIKVYWKIEDAFIAETGNGYWGYVDPLPMLKGKYKRRWVLSKSDYYESGKKVNS